MTRTCASGKVNLTYSEEILCIFETIAIASSISRQFKIDKMWLNSGGGVKGTILLSEGVRSLS
jgi:hypothetical protein